MRLSIKHLHKHVLIAITALVFGFQTKAAVGADGVDFGTLTVDGTEFEFSCDWIYHGSEALAAKTNRDFILHNGLIYFNNYTTKSAYDFAIIDAATGAFKETVTLAWPGTATKQHAMFVGHDSEGTPFCSTEGTPTTAFELCTLKFDAAGRPVADKMYNLPLDDGWYVRSVDVDGDLASGNFILYAAVWKSASLLNGQSTETGLAAWKLSNGSVVEKQTISKHATVIDIEPLGSSRFIIVSRGAVQSKKDVDFTTPTICEWILDSKQFNKIETFPGKMFTNCNNSLELFSLAGKQFMAYWNGTGLVKEEGRLGSHFGLAYTPELPESFGSTQTVIEKFGLGTMTLNYEDEYEGTWQNNSSVHTEKISEKSVRIVINDRGGNLRSYTLSTNASATPVVTKSSPIFTPASGSTLKKGDSVNISCEGSLVILYKLNDGTTETYSGSITPEVDCTIEAWGVYSDGEGPHATATYTVEQPIVKHAPVFTPASGSILKKGDSVNISCEGSLVILYKLNDGTTETYSGSITPEADCTIEAWGVYSDGEGPHATATYSVEQPIVKHAPVFTPASGSILKKGDSVNISCEGSLVILYKLNGGTTETYNGAITPEADCTIEAWGVYSDGEGPHATATYTVEQPIVKHAPVFTPASGSTLKKGDSVNISCDGSLVILYKLNDGNTETYSGSITPEVDCTIEAWGVYSDGEGPHATATYTVEQPIVKHAPVFTPASGSTLKKGDSVNISCEGSLVILYKLNDGTTETYSDPITPEADCTVEAWGVYSDGEGPHATATYTVEQPVQVVAPTFNPVSGSVIQRGDKIGITCKGSYMILYKYDGGKATVYSGPIEPEKDCKIEAWGLFDIGGVGPHATATYTVRQNIPKVAPVFNPPSGSILEVGEGITITCEGAVSIQYTFNGGISKDYKEAIIPEKDCTIEARGIYLDGEGPRVKATYKVNREIVKVAPVFDPPSGSTLSVGDKVNVTCKDATLVLYRVNNGDITPYLFEPITIETDCTIEAWGVYPDSDGPHSFAQYYVESDNCEYYLLTSSSNDLESGMQVRFAGLDSGVLYAAMPYGISGVSGGAIGGESTYIKSTAAAGTYTIDVCNRGGYNIYDNASSTYMRLLSDGQLGGTGYDDAGQFAIGFENRNENIFAVITSLDGSKTMVYDTENGNFVFKPGARSNVLIYRYAPDGRPVVPDALYLHATTDGMWNFAEPVEINEQNDNLLIFKPYHVAMGKDAEIFFSDTQATETNDAADWLEVTKGTIYLPVDDIYDAESGAIIGMKTYADGFLLGQSSPTVRLKGGFNYIFSIEFGGYNPRLHITSLSVTTSIETPTIEGQTEYYNLQGLRVVNPAKGIYIERRGDKTRKVFIH